MASTTVFARLPGNTRLGLYLGVCVVLRLAAAVGAWLLRSYIATHAVTLSVGLLATATLSWRLHGPPDAHVWWTRVGHLVMAAGLAVVSGVALGLPHTWAVHLPAAILGADVLMGLLTAAVVQPFHH